MQATYYDYLRWVEQQNQPQVVNQPANMPVLAQVANKTAAELYNVMPGQRAILVDMDAPVIYVKQRGQDNRLFPLEVYDLVKHEDKPVEPVSMEGYVKYEDLNRVVSEEVEKRLSAVFKKEDKE